MANIILSLWPILAIPRDLLPLNPKEGFYPENTARLLPTLKRNPDFYSFKQSLAKDIKTPVVSEKYLHTSNSVNYPFLVLPHLTLKYGIFLGGFRDPKTKHKCTHISNADLLIVLGNSNLKNERFLPLPFIWKITFHERGSFNGEILHLMGKFFI